MPLVLRLFGQGASDPWRAAWLRRVMAMFGLGLLAVTWRLWTPQQVFPQVPLVALATKLPGWCDWLGLAGMTLGLLLALVAPDQGRWANRGLLLFAASAAALFALDQNRLQPWAYQFVIMALVLAWADARSGIALARLFVASFYFHSALTKFDFSFLHTLGQQFLAALAGVAGGSIENWNDSARLAAALVFPLGELAVAAGLCFARTRSAALVGALALHVLLLVILGPWGLDHKPGVLLWNVYFIVQDVLLFAPDSWLRRLGRWPPQPVDEPARLPWRVRGLVAAVVLLPLLAPIGWFDMWPSWGLYAASSERVVLLVHRSQLDALPDSLAPFVETPQESDDPWLRVRLDRWALAALGAPIYPQCRFQLGAAQALIERYVPGHRVRVVRLGLADRWTGARAHDVLTSLAQLQAAGDEYIWNTLPRRDQFAAAARVD
ncbi:MAG: hypothetical protein WD845_08175 [Pirellulales bacterium]